MDVPRLPTEENYEHLKLNKHLLTSAD